VSRGKILVTGTGGTGTGAGILQALHRKRDAWETIAVDANWFAWGLYAADHGELVPYANHPCYLERIQGLITEYGISAVIPGTEAEAALLARNRDSLPVPVIANRAELMPLMQDKRRAQKKLASLGLPYVPSFPWDRRDDAVAEFGFPLVVKPMKYTSGSRGLHLIISQQELDSLAASFLYAEALPDVQPYLNDANHEYTVGVLSDLSGKIIDSIVIRRQLTGFSLHTGCRLDGEWIAVSTGFTQGVVIRHPEIQGFCEDLAIALDSRGPLNFQLRLHHGKPHVFEIHPRFSASTGIRSSVGFNEPDVLLRHWLDGDKPGRLDYESDVAAIRVFDHVLVPGWQER
jgi:carbamoyl-phosphate synthase large subunit